MPEYFDVSLIVKKTEASKEIISKCLIDEFELSQGENKAKYFADRNVLVSFIEDDEADFEEIFIGFPDQVFHKDKFEEELKVFTSFIGSCFECCSELRFALCSYELNGYFIGEAKKLIMFTD